MDQLLLNSNYLERKHIDAMLQEADKLPLVFVVAPMGYGKTTAVYNFLKHKEGTKVWLPFGQNEVDEVWIWTRLCIKLDALDFPFSSAIQENGLPQNQYEVDNFISLIENSFKEPFYLILDDCQECESLNLIRLVESVAQSRIKNLHLFLLSRTYLPMHYEAFWLKNICTVIGQSALALTPQEITDFFALNYISLPPKDLQQIYEYTEGWMSAVYLILTDYRRNGKFRNLGGINTLVHTFIFQHIPDHGKTLLMKLSLLDTFTLEQAVYITETEECTVLLPRLEETISFFKYDPASDYYIIHAVLRSALRVELEKSGIDRKQIYLRSGEWYQNNGSYIYAIQSYQKAGNTSKVFAVLEQYGCGTVYDSAPNVLKNFFQSISTEEAFLHPTVYLPYISLIILNEEVIRGSALFQEAKDFYSTHECPGISSSEIMGELYMIQWSLEFNDLEKMVHYAAQAYRLLGSNHTSFSPFNFVLTYGAPETLLLYHRETGNLKRTVELEKQYTSYYMKLVNGKDCDWQQLYDAEYLFTTGQVSEAEVLADIACKKALLHQQSCIIISAYFLRLRCQLFSGNKIKFNTLMQELKELIRPNSSVVIRMDYEVATGYLYGCLGQIDKMEPWILDFRLENCNRILRSVRSGCVTYGLTLMHKGKWMHLENLADEMSVPYSNSKHLFTQIYAKLCYAISAFHLYGKAKGLEHLTKALEMAEPDGIKMLFAEFMPWIQPLLQELTLKNTFAAEIYALGMAELAGMAALNTKSKEPERPHLTKRELELMMLVSQGFKNMEISQEMNIALVTVEKKLTAVYRKLNVSNRTAALRVLHEYHILK